MATVSNIGALRGNFGDRTLTITFQALEGNATGTTISGPRGDVTGVTYASPIAEGDFVKLSTNCTWGVEICAAGDTSIIGIAQHEPIGPVNATTTEANMITNKTLRTVVVEVFGTMTREVPLEAANTVCAIGSYLTAGATTRNTVDVIGTGYTTTLALADAAASSGDTIPVLWGWFGLMTAN